MTQSEVYANPQRILSLADEINQFFDRLRTETEKMSDGFNHLGETWRDSEHQKFKHAFERLREELEKVGLEVSRREPELKEDAEHLIAYLNKSQ